MKLIDKNKNIYNITNYYKLSMNDGYKNIEWKYIVKKINDAETFFYYNDRKGKQYYFEYLDKWYRIGITEIPENITEFYMYKSKYKNHIDKKSWLNQLFILFENHFKISRLSELIYDEINDYCYIDFKYYKFKIVFSLFNSSKIHLILLYCDIENENEEYKEFYNEVVSKNVRTAFWKIKRHNKLFFRKSVI